MRPDEEDVPESLYVDYPRNLYNTINNILINEIVQAFRRAIWIQ